jgi:hypothetical protein
MNVYERKIKAEGNTSNSISKTKYFIFYLKGINIFR